ncbi:uncharacterized protein LAJ45_09175 [Morchella importuna]|uniref:uncharacterized protein n=1 Tax=Morchella importuna TaxID=1174673 RepID=UPI001E8CCF3D|nr:uncharacterized protein LAJ45_09175 [Morchella importuna]KAH8146801.1 hypothetical protein LAJ45_09175 [Morchella importuna]
MAPPKPLSTLDILICAEEEEEEKRSYSYIEKRNMAIWIIGIMFYKLGLETFQGSITIIALEKWGDEKHRKYGLLRGLDQLFQCVGSILIAPLIRRALLMIIDFGTHGRIKTSISTDPTDESKAPPYLGSFDPNTLFPIMCSSGLVYGMIELIRRIIPRDIVGGNITKLRKMDALVHILYEVSGTLSALLSWLLVSRLGSVYGLVATPGFFACAAMAWHFLALPSPPKSTSRASYAVQLLYGVKYFFQSISKGFCVIFTKRAFMWLPVGYSIALYTHRYIENGLIPFIAQDIFHNPAASRILVSGSNLGELIGAALVFVLGDRIPTPMPWIRADALLLLLVWVLPFYPAQDTSTGALWRLAPLFIPISFGWAAGDVSLAAYIQSALAGDRDEQRDENISNLGAVMAFLYSVYIVLFAVLAPVLGMVADKGGDARVTVVWVGGVQVSVVAALLVGSTFVPRGGAGWNPRLGG